MSTTRICYCLARCFDVLVWLLLVSIVAVCVSSTDSTKRNQERFSGDVIVFPKEDMFVSKEKRSEHEEYSRPGFFRNNMDYHKHHPQFPRRMGHSNVLRQNPFNGARDDEMDINDNSDFTKRNDTIPLELIREINEIGDVNEVARKFVEGDEHVYSDSELLTDRFSPGERNAAIKPKPAGCMPELQTVKLATSLDASILYIPQCTRIERCGGCCSHHLLTCQPIETQAVSFAVLKTQYVGGKSLKLVGKEIVVLEKHIKCKCDCRVKAEDCNRFQVFKQTECRCSCINTDDEKKCYRKNQTKLWDPELCSCICREVSPCSTGFVFDPKECKCAPVPVRNRYIEAEPRYDIEE